MSNLKFIRIRLFSSLRSPVQTTNNNNNNNQTYQKLLGSRRMASSVPR